MAHQQKNKLLAAAIDDPYVTGFIIYLSAMSIDMVFKEGVWDKGGQYSEGKNAAVLFLTLAYGILNRDALQTDIIVKAQKRANDIMENNSEVYSDPSKATTLSAAVCEVTIENRMKNHYIGRGAAKTAGS